MRISFVLDEDDLKHLRARLRGAKVPETDLEIAQVLSSAESLVKRVRETKVPDYVDSRVSCLLCMTHTVRDPDWPLPPSVQRRVLKALSYFARVDDLIHDETPTFGFLDDAIMIELVAMELGHELDAYEDYRNFRETTLERELDEQEVERRLMRRRKELRARIQEREARAPGRIKLTSGRRVGRASTERSR